MADRNSTSINWSWSPKYMKRDWQNERRNWAIMAVEVNSPLNNWYKQQTKKKKKISKDEKDLNNAPSHFKLNQKMTNSSFFKIGKCHLNRHFIKEDVHIYNKHLKRCLATLVLEKCQSEPQWHITTRPSECLFKKTQRPSLQILLVRMWRQNANRCFGKWWGNLLKY